MAIYFVSGKAKTEDGSMDFYDVVNVDLEIIDRHGLRVMREIALSNAKMFVDEAVTDVSFTTINRMDIRSPKAD